MMRRGIRRLPACVAVLSASFAIPQIVLAQSSDAPAGRQKATEDFAAQSPRSSEIEVLKQQLQQQQKQIQALQVALDKQEQLLDQIVLLDNNPRDDSGRTQRVELSAGTLTHHSVVPPLPKGEGCDAYFPGTDPDKKLIPLSALSPGERVAEGRVRGQTGLLDARHCGPNFPQQAPPSTPREMPSRALVASSAKPPILDASGAGLADTTSEGPQQNPALVNSPIKPLPLHIGNATLTPVGFIDATAFFRSRNLGSGIGTAFGSLPFSNTAQGRLSETRLTAQNSRVGLMMDSQFDGNKVRGYLETDFLGAQPANAFVTSNSDSLRLRLYWMDLMRGKFEFLAGQSWSLLTPGRVGISPMPSDLFYSQDMDTNYQVGLTWSRQLQFRFVYHATPNVTAALSLENPQQYVGGAVVLPSDFNSSQVDNGANTGAPNLHPDIIGKLAFDGHVGPKLMHVELAGLLSTFKTFSPALNGTSSVTGGGGSVNTNLELFKNFHLVATTFASDGGGRYIFGLGPNFIVRPDGTPSLVHAYSGTGGFEWQATPKTMYYGYYGGGYFGRNYSVIPVSIPGGAPTYVGFGFPGSSSAANRAIQEATFGIIRTFWKNQHYGALQLITQYSYITRAPWYVAPGNPKNTNLSQAYADIRYVLP